MSEEWTTITSGVLGPKLACLTLHILWALETLLFAYLTLNLKPGTVKPYGHLLFRGSRGILTPIGWMRRDGWCHGLFACFGCVFLFRLVDDFLKLSYGYPFVIELVGDL